MPAKLVVKSYRGGSRVSLLGASGKELMSSSVFTEPRAKGATLRALKGLLGDDVVVDDQTKPVKGAAAPKTLSAAAAVASAAKVVSESTAAVVEKAARKAGVAPSTRPATRKAAPRKAAARTTAARTTATRKTTARKTTARKVTAKE